MKILLTAFEPFGNLNINTSKEILENININNIYKLLLPVTIDESFIKINEVLKTNQFDLIILLGMAAKRTKVTIENNAYNNLNFNIPDNNGVIINNQKITENDVESINSIININKLVKHLKSKNYNLDISTDPGRYICNYLYFNTLYHYPDIPCMFIHIPLFNEEVTLENSTLLIEEIITYLKK